MKRGETLKKNALPWKKGGRPTLHSRRKIFGKECQKRVKLARRPGTGRYVFELNGPVTGILPRSLQLMRVSAVHAVNPSTSLRGHCASNCFSDAFPGRDKSFPLLRPLIVRSVMPSTQLSRRKVQWSSTEPLSLRHNSRLAHQRHHNCICRVSATF